jgi:hypothetical protein
VEHYVALCGPCHREDDNAERRGLRRRIKELEAELATIRPACETCNSVTGGATRRKGATVPEIRFGRNKSRKVAGRGGAVGGVKPAERKDAPCETCGASPGHACYTVASVKQVAAGKEGAYLKTQKTLHTGRGVVPGDLRPGKR